MPENNGKSIATFLSVTVNATNRKEAAKLAHLLCPYEAGRLIRFPRWQSVTTKEALRYGLENYHLRFPGYDEKRKKEQYAALESVAERGE
jgi:hypothetical protein